MEVVSLFPSINVKFTCQKRHIPHIRSLWAALDVAANTASSQAITAADFASLPQALETVKRNLRALQNDALPASQLMGMVWGKADRETVQNFIQQTALSQPSYFCSDRESLSLGVSAQNVGLLSALWSVLESNDPRHQMNLEIASLPRALVLLQTTLDQLLLPAIDQSSCFDPLVRAGMAAEIVDHWSAVEKDYISRFVGWTLPVISYSNSHRLN